MGDHGQIEVHSDGETHTLYEFCGFDTCRELILEKGFEITEDPFTRDEFELEDGDGEYVTVTVQNSLDESDRCVWCYGCGDFLRHGLSCTCAEEGHDPTQDREPLRPLVVENGQLELRPWQ